MRRRYEVVIAIQEPWDATRMLPIRSAWSGDGLCDLLARAHQRSTRDAAECAGDPARLVAIRPKRRTPAVEVVYRVGSHECQAAKALAVAASAALRAFGTDFESVSPPVTAERLVVTAKRQSRGTAPGSERSAERR